MFVLGTAQFSGIDYGSGGNHLSKLTNREIHNILLNAYRNGIRRLDTAQAYGNAEEILGNFKMSYPGYPLQIGTKLSFNGFNTEGKLTKKGYRYLDTVLDVSLANLNLPKLDSVVLHKFSEFENIDLWNWLKSKKEKREIDRIGVSVYYKWEIIKALTYSDIDILQIPFNLLSTSNISKGDDLGILIKNKKKQNRKFILDVRSVFLQGILVNLDYVFWKKIPNMTPQIFEEYRDLLLELKEKFNRDSLADLAVNYVRHFDWIDGIILGCDSVNHLENNAILFRKDPLTKEQVQEVQSRFTDLILKTPLILDPSQWHKDLPLK